MVNNCNERSVQSYLTSSCGKDYPYNPFNFFIYKGAGIIAPATPGRYKIAIATKSFPEPIESEAFVLPCSSISSVILDPVPLKKSPTLFSVSFKTGEGGALDSYYSTINLRLPNTVKVRDTISNAGIEINGKQLPKEPTISRNEDFIDIKLPLPTNINNLSDVQIDFGLDCGIDIADSRVFMLEVATSSEPVFVSTNIAEITINAETILTKPEEFVISDMYVRMPLKDGAILDKGAIMELAFPVGFRFPVRTDETWIYVNGHHVKASIDHIKRIIGFESPIIISKAVVVAIPKECMIVNPKSGEYRLYLKILGKSFACGDLRINISKAFIDFVSLSKRQAGVETDLSFIFKPASGTTLAKGDKIKIVFPPGTIISNKLSNLQVVTDGVKAETVEIGEESLSATIGCDIGFEYPVLFWISANLKNPPNRHGYSFKLVMPDGQECSSEPIELDPAPLKSLIYFINPTAPQCKDWFNSSVQFGFDCMNPEAEIYYWANGQTGERRLFDGKTLTLESGYQMVDIGSISWQAEFQGIKEEPQTTNFKIDTDHPFIKFLNPKNDPEYTNKKNYTVVINRHQSRVNYFGNTTDYVMTDEITAETKGREQLLVESKIHKLYKNEPIPDIEYNTELHEGLNKLFFKARDQACNENIFVANIVLDTFAPGIEIVEPNLAKEYKIGESIVFKIKTEPDTTVTINGKVVNNVLYFNEANSIYQTWFTPESANNTIETSATDKAGNTTKKIIVLKARIPGKTITIKLESRDWTVNGIVRVPFNTAPTSTNLPKDLVGNAYIPIREITGVLNVAVNWDQQSKKITLVQNNPGDPKRTIELWIGKKDALINGKSVPIDSKRKLYPVVVNGATMLPLRFVAENLGAVLNFDAKSKTITIIYGN